MKWNLLIFALVSNLLMSHLRASDLQDEVLREHMKHATKMMVEEQRLKEEAKEEARRERQEPERLILLKKLDAEAVAKRDQLLVAKVDFLRELENYVAGFNSLTLVKKAADILMALFGVIGEEGTENDFKKLEELIIERASLLDMRTSYYEENELTELFNIIDFEHSKVSEFKVYKLLKNYRDNKLLCKNSKNYFDLSLFVGIGGSMNVYKQSCISMFGQAFSARGFNVGAGVGAGGGLFFAPYDCFSKYDYLATYKEQTKLQVKNKFGLHVYDAIIAIHKSLETSRSAFDIMAHGSGPADGSWMIGAGTWLVGGVTEEREFAWLKRVDKNTIKQRRRIWKSLQRFLKD